MKGGDIMEFNLSNILLAGIGSLAFTYEKATEIIDELVKKGELTVKQGKELNEELKRKMTKNITKDALLTKEDVKEIIAELNLATKLDIEELKTRLDKLENK
jgi:polyhydroxyalkanoate synthesis regulator phasin